MTRSCLMLVSALIFSGAAVGCQGDAPQVAESPVEQTPPFPGAQGGAVDQASAAERPPADEHAPAVEESAGAPTEAHPPLSDVSDAEATAALRAQDELPARRKVEGVAHNAKLGAVLVAGDGVHHWVDLAAWPDEVLGQAISLEGVPVMRSDLPLVAPGPGGEQSAGVPQPQGQSRAEGARRQVITEAVWTLVK